MRTRFGTEELQDIQLAEPFSFTKGCRTMKIPARIPMDAHSFGTLLFDLQQDPGQMNPRVDDSVERRMIQLLLERLQANDAPVEQYDRLGLPKDGNIQAEHLQTSAR